MNERIQQLSEHIGKTLPNLILEAENDILEAIDVAREGHDGDKPLVATLPVSIKWNTDDNKIEVKLSVAVKHNYTSEASLPDPNQPELIDSDGNPLPEKMARPLKAISRAMREHGENFGEEGGGK